MLALGYCNICVSVHSEWSNWSRLEVIATGALLPINTASGNPKVVCFICSVVFITTAISQLSTHGCHDCSVFAARYLMKEGLIFQEVFGRD